MGGVLTEFVGILTGGIADLSTGIGSGVNSFVTDLFLVEGADGAYTLSTFGGTVAIFGGVALAVGLTTLVFNWIRSIGK